MWLFVLLVIFLLCYWWKNYASFPHPKFPPGPYGLPLVGYLPVHSEENIFIGFEKLHQKYGKVFSLNLGPNKRCVVIGDFQMLKEAFSGEKTNARPPHQHFFNKEFRFGDGTDSRGIVYSEGEEWSQQRRFALRRLRDFGLGKSSMENLINEEVDELLKLFDKKLNKATEVTNLFNLSVINGLWKIVTGARFNLEDPKLKNLVKRLEYLFYIFGNASLLLTFPSLRHVFPEWTGWKKCRECVADLCELVRTFMDDHKSKFSMTEEPKDFIDAYLKEIQESQPGSSFHGELGEQNLQSVVLDLLMAGSETTSTWLTWSLLLMIKYPEIQGKVREEILNNVGKARMVSLEDKPNLPYTEAVIEEVSRFSFGTLGLPHYAKEDFSIGDFVITKDTMILGNLYQVMHNSQTFPDPYSFKPERFLSEDGKTLKKNSETVIFSIGKRECPGKSLAQAEMFLFFAGMMQRYNFQSVFNDLNLLNLIPKMGVTPVPKPFQVLINKN